MSWFSIEWAYNEAFISNTHSQSLRPKLGLLDAYGLHLSMFQSQHVASNIGPELYVQILI